MEKLPQGTWLWEMHKSHNIYCSNLNQQGADDVNFRKCLANHKKGKEVTVPRRIEGEHRQFQPHRCISSSPLTCAELMLQSKYVMNIFVKCDPIGGGTTFCYILLNITMVYAYILHCHASIGLVQEPMTRQDFLLSMVFTLINNNFLGCKKNILECTQSKYGSLIGANIN